METNKIRKKKNGTKWDKFETSLDIGTRQGNP